MHTNWLKRIILTLSHCKHTNSLNKIKIVKAQQKDCKITTDCEKPTSSPKQTIFQIFELKKATNKLVATNKRWIEQPLLMTIFPKLWIRIIALISCKIQENTIKR